MVYPHRLAITADSKTIVFGSFNQIFLVEMCIRDRPELGSPEGPRPADPALAEVSAVRSFLLSRGNSAIADRGFQWLMVLCALSIFGIVVLIAVELVLRSQLAWSKFGFGFFFSAFIDPATRLPMYWDPVNGHFSALPFLYGTLVSSFLALLMAVPLAIGVAVFLTEMCPRVLRGPLAFLTELLAAIPSVIYGLWAVFVLVPLLREHVNPLLIRLLGWTSLFNDDNPTGLGFLAAGVILAIMILPIISSLTREVMTAVPHSQREAVLAPVSYTHLAGASGHVSRKAVGDARNWTLALLLLDQPAGGGADGICTLGLAFQQKSSAVGHLGDGEMCIRDRAYQAVAAEWSPSESWASPL